jgi:hypothetical protein
MRGAHAMKTLKTLYLNLALTSPKTKELPSILVIIENPSIFLSNRAANG